MAHFCEPRCHLELAFLAPRARAGSPALGMKRPDLVFVYLNFATTSPAEFIREISAAAPNAKLILFIEGCREYLVHLVSASFYNGLLCVGEATLDELGRIIENIVQQGIRFVSPTIMNCLNGLRADADSFPKLLTKTQMSVLICISHSLSDEEIAARLHCSPGTVLSHRREIMRKLNIHATPKLIRYGIEKGFDAVPLPTVDRIRSVQRTEEPQ